jgi:hypothetical protein
MIQQDELTRHAVCLGMTGSGKTGLCVGLLEDVARARVPILAVDPKGDLANLALVFPELTQDAFAPWTSEPERLARLWVGQRATGRDRGLRRAGGGAGVDAGQ